MTTIDFSKTIKSTETKTRCSKVIGKVLIYHQPYPLILHFRFKCLKSNHMLFKIPYNSKMSLTIYLDVHVSKLRKKEKKRAHWFHYTV